MIANRGIFRGLLLAITAISIVSGNLRAEGQPSPEAPKDPDVDKMLKIGVPTEDGSAKPKDAAKSDLPRVLLIGDSISGGYLGEVSTLLKGKAFVKRGNNGGPSTEGLEMIDEIVADGPWDVIHFNWGLHDMTWQFKMPQEKRGIDKYAERLEEIVQHLEKTNAKLIWATTTPWCPETYGYAAQRYKQELKYTVPEQLEWKNAALEVMQKHGIPVRQGDPRVALPPVDSPP